MPAAAADPLDSAARVVSAEARDLPWRRPGTSPWAVLVSEVMLQQTPVSRVLPAYDAWLKRWPDPAALAADSAGEAVRQWGRLGYPRRALRLHAAAVVCVTRHDGQVPADPEQLRALPGVGSYTAAAVAAFAFGQRIPVVDTNVRRVVARWSLGLPAALTHPGRGRRRVAAGRAGRCRSDLGRTDGAGRPGVREPQSPLRRLPDGHRIAAGSRRVHRQRRRPGVRTRPAQGYEGTDRQARGRLLAVLRVAREPVAGADLDQLWPDPVQRDRALASLLGDGLGACRLRRRATRCRSADLIELRLAAAAA